MNSKIIAMKDLHRNLKRVADAVLKGRSYTVVRDSKPVFRIEPVEIVAHRKGGGNTLADFLKAASFHDADRNLSMKVDEIVYGGRS